MSVPQYPIYLEPMIWRIDISVPNAFQLVVLWGSRLISRIYCDEKDIDQVVRWCLVVRDFPSLPKPTHIVAGLCLKSDHSGV